MCCCCLLVGERIMLRVHVYRWVLRDVCQPFRSKVAAGIEAAGDLPADFHVGVGVGGMPADFMNGLSMKAGVKLPGIGAARLV